MASFEKLIIVMANACPGTNLLWKVAYRNHTAMKLKQTYLNFNVRFGFQRLMFRFSIVCLQFNSLIEHLLVFFFCISFLFLKLQNGFFFGSVQFLSSLNIFPRNFIIENVICLLMFTRRVFVLIFFCSSFSLHLFQTFQLYKHYRI